MNVSPLPKNLSLVAVVRHGQSVGNVDVSAYRDIPGAEHKLTDLGKLQAESIGNSIYEYMTECGLDWSLNKTTIISSPWKRAFDTAQCIARWVTRKDIKKDVLLTEQQYGAAEGGQMKDFINRDKIWPHNMTSMTEKSLYFLMGNLYYRASRGDSLMDVYQRVGLFVERKQWFTGHPFVVIVAHRVVCHCMHSILTGDELPNDIYCTERPLDNEWHNGQARIYGVNQTNRTALLRKTINQDQDQDHDIYPTSSRTI